MLAEKLLKPPSAVANYIEDVFSTYLYTGNGTSQSISNGIDLASKGGMTWIKSRSAAENNCVFDTARGVKNYLLTNTTDSQLNFGNFGVTAFDASGFTVTGGSGYAVDTSAETYASWTFRKQPKFFDVVTYTGTGAVQNIAHNLGSVPGFMAVKKTSASGTSWFCYHTSLGATKTFNLDTTTAAGTVGTVWNNTDPTSSVFTVGTGGAVNSNGDTFVAYLFANNAGGFGLTGTDNVISCGSYTGNGSATGPVVTLGYEPQWVLIKRATGGVGNWSQFDNMRGLTVNGSNSALLRPNLSDAEYVGTGLISPTATGFSIDNNLSTYNNNGDTYIYIAIRRGPMKVPTSGTTVYGEKTWGGPGSTTFNTFPPDFATRFERNNYNSATPLISARLVGSKYLTTSASSAEASGVFTWDNAGGGASVSFGVSTPLVSHFIARAPNFFDVVCYTGTGSAQNLNHNLGVVPELMIVKSRSNTYSWAVYSATLGNASFLTLNSTAASTASSTTWNSTTPTSSVFTVGGVTTTGYSGFTYVAYLFASCPGVSKVGSYTGNGTNQTINCGFTGGARFVLIKRTDDTGDWYVYDTARGMTTLVDPYLLFNSTAAETATLGSVTTVTTGFKVDASILAAVNTNAATYIYLAIA